MTVDDKIWGAFDTEPAALFLMGLHKFLYRRSFAENQSLFIKETPIAFLISLLGVRSAEDMTYLIRRRFGEGIEKNVAC